MPRLILAWISSLWLLAAGTAIAATPPLPVDMTPVRVSTHAWYVPGGTGIATDNYGFVSNSAFVVTDDGIVVFDTLGTPALGRRLLAAIRTISDAPIRRIYISHYHADHFYGPIPVTRIPGVRD